MLDYILLSVTLLITFHAGVLTGRRNEIKAKRAMIFVVSILNANMFVTILATKFEIVLNPYLGLIPAFIGFFLQQLNNLKDKRKLK